MFVIIQYNFNLLRCDIVVFSLCNGLKYGCFQEYILFYLNVFNFKFMYFNVRICYGVNIIFCGLKCFFVVWSECFLFLI